MKKIAFIGLGNMGGPMATNLVQAGFEVYGFDPVAAVPTGVQACASGAEAAAQAEVVITMLPNGKILKAVYEELLTAAPTGTLFIDCSTVDVADAREASEMAVAAGHRPGVDAPVSGGIVGAQNATLTFMVGAQTAEFEAAQTLFELFALKGDGTKRTAALEGDVVTNAKADQGQQGSA